MVEEFSDMVVAFFFAQPGQKLADAYSFLAVEVALQSHGKEGLLRERNTLPPRERFAVAIHDALAIHRVLLVVDGLDDMDARLLAFEVMKVQQEAQDLNPKALLQCVLSCNAVPAQPLHTSQGDMVDAYHRVEVEGLSDDEKLAICHKNFSRFGKDNVAHEQVVIALEKEDSHLPLYLLLFCSEASLLAVFEEIEMHMTAFPHTIAELWGDWILPRLENTYGEPIVKFVMQRLLASPKGMGVSDLKQMAEEAEELLSDTGASPGANVEELRDAIMPLQAYVAGDVIALASAKIRAGTMARYAPRAVEQKGMFFASQIIKATAEAEWRKTRNTPVEASKAVTVKPGVDKKPAATPVPPPPKEKAPEETMREGEVAFTFPAERKFRHRSLKVSDDGITLTKVSGSDETACAILQPALSATAPSYLEMTVREEGGDVARAAVRSGILTATKDTLKRVPDKVAASGHKLGWLYNTGNGNVLHNGMGNKFTQTVCRKGDTVGFLVDPLQQTILVYVNRILLAPFPIDVAGFPSFKDPVHFVVELNNDHQVVTVEAVSPDYKPPRK
ncbi:hypothetical protein T484DRAFT_1899569 [Baffinella frigidus]|nr:hypothetical protein T484DRAFT_1899569 [Cryptophyta sp. CCMP2293]